VLPGWPAELDGALDDDPPPASRGGVPDRPPELGCAPDGDEPLPDCPARLPAWPNAIDTCTGIDPVCTSHESSIPFAPAGVLLPGADGAVPPEEPSPDRPDRDGALPLPPEPDVPLDELGGALPGPETPPEPDGFPDEPDGWPGVPDGPDEPAEPGEECPLPELEPPGGCDGLAPEPGELPGAPEPEPPAECALGVVKWYAGLDTTPASEPPAELPSGVSWCWPAVCGVDGESPSCCPLCGAAPAGSLSSPGWFAVLNDAELDPPAASSCPPAAACCPPAGRLVPA
jgi:hypothetical protein